MPWKHGNKVMVELSRLTEMDGFGSQLANYTRRQSKMRGLANAGHLLPPAPCRF